MKKTFVMLLACCGVAFGATVGQIDTTDTSLKSYFDFSTGNTQTAGTFTGQWQEYMLWNEDGQYGTAQYKVIGDNNNCMAAEGANDNNILGLSVKNNGVTISFDINNIRKTGTLLSVFSGGQKGFGDMWKSMKVDVAQAAESETYTLTTTIGEKSITADIGTVTDWTTLTFVATPTTGNYLLLDIYMNGEVVASYDEPYGATNFVNDGLNRLQFGYWGNANNATAVDVDNILIYDRALSATEIKSLTIPEPTTATLSLLALAGLAARRRRK